MKEEDKIMSYSKFIAFFGFPTKPILLPLFFLPNLHIGNKAPKRNLLSVAKYVNNYFMNYKTVILLSTNT
jgi:hypothetical protein